jgi:AmmeMemoRadiSam system protein B
MIFIVIASWIFRTITLIRQRVRLDTGFINLLEEYDLKTLEAGYHKESLEACGLGPILTLWELRPANWAARCQSVGLSQFGDTYGMRAKSSGYVTAIVYE